MGSDDFVGSLRSMAELDAAIAASGLGVRRAQPNIGALISGVDLTRPLSPAVRDGIWAAFCKYQVVFFRDQPLERAQHIAFGRQFGVVTGNAKGIAEYPEINAIISDGKTPPAANQWHSDLSFDLQPPSASILRFVSGPEVGGDTVFSSAVAVYDSLGEEMQARLEKLEAVHDFMHLYQRKPIPGLTEAQWHAKYPAVVHPVVRIHPNTGIRSIYVSDAYTSKILGVSARQSDELLRELTIRFLWPENQCRFSWRPGSIAMWDNRSVQHYPVNDYREPRHMERIALAGDTPFGPASRGRMLGTDDVHSDASSVAP